MRKIVLFIASSLDSYIARPSGEIDEVIVLLEVPSRRTMTGYS